MALAEAQSALQAKAETLEAAERDMEAAAAEIRTTGAQAATVESAKRNAERRSKGRCPEGIGAWRQSAPPRLSMFSAVSACRP